MHSRRESSDLVVRKIQGERVTGSWQLSIHSETLLNMLDGESGPRLCCFGSKTGLSRSSSAIEKPIQMVEWIRRARPLLVILRSGRT